MTNGQFIRLQHATSRRWLHSHTFTSPLSNQQEVSCFGSDSETDAGDIWQIEWDDKSKIWLRDGAVRCELEHQNGYGAHSSILIACFYSYCLWSFVVCRFKHKVTGAYLSNHGVQYQRPIPGHTEVFASKSKGASATFRATEGVYFPGQQQET